MKKEEYREYGLVKALKPFSVLAIAKRVHVSRSYFYMCDQAKAGLPDDLKEQLKNILIEEAQRLESYARSL